MIFTTLCVRAQKAGGPRPEYSFDGNRFGRRQSAVKHGNRGSNSPTEFNLGIGEDPISCHMILSNVNGGRSEGPKSACRPWA